jgi:hypothetical protein
MCCNIINILLFLKLPNGTRFAQRWYGVLWWCGLGAGGSVEVAGLNGGGGARWRRRGSVLAPLFCTALGGGGGARCWSWRWQGSVVAVWIGCGGRFVVMMGLGGGSKARRWWRGYGGGVGGARRW